MNSIKLTVINKSKATNHPPIVVFQRNKTIEFAEGVVAWMVIDHLGQDESYSFNLPVSQTVSCSDSYGNFTPHMVADPGQSYHMVLDGDGNELKMRGAATSPEEVQVRNSLDKGAITANIHKDSKLLAVVPNIAPGQKAKFQIDPTLYIGTVNQAKEGKVILSGILKNVTELSLLGIASADIVMTGGGPGKDSETFQFSLENIIKA